MVILQEDSECDSSPGVCSMHRYINKKNMHLLIHPGGSRKLHAYTVHMLYYTILFSEIYGHK